MLLPVLALALTAAPIGPPDGGILILDPDAGAALALPGLERFASSSEAVQVSRGEGDVLNLRPIGPTGTQLDAWLRGGAHVQTRVFVRERAVYPELGLDFLPLTHSPAIIVRDLGDRLLIRGPLGSVEDAVALEILAEAHPKVLALGALRASKLEEALATLNAGLPKGARAVWAGDRAVLRGHLEPEVRRALEEKADTALGLVGNGIRAGRIWVAPDAELDAQVIELGVGTQRVLHLSGASRVGVNKPEVADARLAGHDQVLLVGMNEGTSRLELWGAGGVRHDFVVRVEKWECGLSVGMLARMFKADAGVHVRMIGDRIYLQGDVSSVEEAAIVSQVLTLYPNVVLLDPPSEARLQAQADAVNAHLRAAGVTAVRAVRTGTKLWFEGTPDDPSETAIAQGWAAALFEPFARLPREVRPPK